METKTATVKQVKPLPNQDKYGNFSYNLQFDNGDEGLFSTKTDQVGSIGIIVGQPFTYVIEKKVSAAGKDWFKISKPQVDNGFQKGGQSKDPAVQKMIIAQSSLSSAVEFYKGSTLDTDDLLVCAKKFYDWVIKTAK